MSQVIVMDSAFVQKFCLVYITMYIIPTQIIYIIRKPRLIILYEILHCLVFIPLITQYGIRVYASLALCHRELQPTHKNISLYLPYRKTSHYIQSPISLHWRTSLIFLQRRFYPKLQSFSLH